MRGDLKLGVRRLPWKQDKAVDLCRHKEETKTTVAREVNAGHKASLPARIFLFFQHMKSQNFCYLSSLCYKKDGSKLSPKNMQLKARCFHVTGGRKAVTDKVSIGV